MSAKAPATVTFASVLRIPAFRDLWLGQAISQLGDALYYVTFLFMAKKLTGSDAVVGFVGAMETLPYLLFGAFAGVAADRFNRRQLMLASDILGGITLITFGIWAFFNPKIGLPALLVIPFVLSTLRCFFMPAKSAAIPALVPAEKLQTATSLSMMTQNLMPMMGLALSAGVLGVVYQRSPDHFLLVAVGLNAVSFLISAIFIARLPSIIPDRKQINHPWEDFREGIRYIRQRRDLSVMLIVMTGFRLCIAPFFVAYLAANDAWFDGKPQTVSWLEFGFFAGMVTMAPFVGRMKITRPGLSFALGLLAVGVLVLFMAFARNFWIFLTWNFLCGLAVPLADIPITTYCGLSVPDGFLGRVNAVMNMIANGVMPLGTALGGMLIAGAGIQAGFLAMGFGCCIACLVGVLDPVFRRVRMPEPGVEKSNDAGNGYLPIPNG